MRAVFAGGLLVALLLTGCAAPPVPAPTTIPRSTLMPGGPLVAAPPGWLDYCETRGADDPGCPPKPPGQSWSGLFDGSDAP